MINVALFDKPYPHIALCLCDHAALENNKLPHTRITNKQYEEYQ